MRTHTRSHRRALTLTLGIELALVLIGFGLHNAIAAAHAATPSAEAAVGALEHGATFAGVGAEGVDMIWTGPLQGALTGEATVRVQYIGAESDRNQPTWPVRALVFAATDDATKAFVGDLGGSMNWRTGEMQLSGPATDGWHRNGRIEQTLSLNRERLDGTGTIHFVERTAER